MNALMWHPDFMGTGTGIVTDGPSAGWRMLYESQGQQFLFRNLTVGRPDLQGSPPALMSDTDIQRIRAVESLREITWFVDTSFEGAHGAVHNWVGGPMADLPNAPADPVFYLHHAFVDCLWEELREIQRARTPPLDPRFDYPNDTAALGVGIEQPDGRVLRDASRSFHFSTNEMRPFGPMRNIDGHKSEYTNVHYSCARRPTCSQSNPDCGSDFLFCDRNALRCVPKLQEGGNCSRFISSSSEPCYRSECCEHTGYTCSSRCADRGQRPRSPGVGRGPDVIHGPPAAPPPIPVRDRVPIPVPTPTPTEAPSTVFTTPAPQPTPKPRPVTESNTNTRSPLTQRPRFTPQLITGVSAPDQLGRRVPPPSPARPPFRPFQRANQQNGRTVHFTPGTHPGRGQSETESPVPPNQRFSPRRPRIHPGRGETPTEAPAPPEHPVSPRHPSFRPQQSSHPSQPRYRFHNRRQFPQSFFRPNSFRFNNIDESNRFDNFFLPFRRFDNNIDFFPFRGH